MSDVPAYVSYLIPYLLKQIYGTYGVYYLYHELLCNNFDNKFRIASTFEQKSYIIYIIIQPTAIPITTFTKLNLHQIQSNLPLNLFLFYLQLLIK